MIGHLVVTTLVVAVVGVLVLGWRDRAGVELPEHLTVLLVMFIGLALAMAWELGQFVLDWTLGLHLQPTNTDTMLDLLASDIGAVVGAVLGAWLYCHVLRSEQRQAFGRVGVWLLDGPSRVLDKHGLAMTLAFTVVIGVALAALWFTGRPVPGFPIG